MNFERKRGKVQNQGWMLRRESNTRDNRIQIKGDSLIKGIIVKNQATH